MRARYSAPRRSGQPRKRAKASEVPTESEERPKRLPKRGSWGMLRAMVRAATCCSSVALVLWRGEGGEGERERVVVIVRRRVWETLGRVWGQGSRVGVEGGWECWSVCVSLCLFW